MAAAKVEGGAAAVPEDAPNGPAESEPNPSDSPDVLTIAQVAKRLGLSTETVRRHARRGTLPFDKIGGTWLMPRERLIRGLRRGFWNYDDTTE
jgi:excisionase family DNA binding protein